MTSLMWTMRDRGRWEEAERVFVRMRALGIHPDTGAVNALISAYRCRPALLLSAAV